MQHLPGRFCMLSCSTCSVCLQIAVLKEVDGKGPFSSLVMAVVVVKDVVVIMAYALNMELIRAVSMRCKSKPIHSTQTVGQGWVTSEVLQHDSHCKELNIQSHYQRLN